MPITLPDFTLKSTSLLGSLEAALSKYDRALFHYDGSVVTTSSPHKVDDSFSFLDFSREFERLSRLTAATSDHDDFIYDLSVFIIVVYRNAMTALSLRFYAIKTNYDKNFKYFKGKFLIPGRDPEAIKLSVQSLNSKFDAICTALETSLTDEDTNSLPLHPRDRDFVVLSNQCTLLMDEITHLNNRLDAIGNSRHASFTRRTATAALIVSAAAFVIAGLNVSLACYNFFHKDDPSKANAALTTALDTMSGDINQLNQEFHSFSISFDKFGLQPDGPVQGMASDIKNISKQSGDARISIATTLDNLDKELKEISGLVNASNSTSAQADAEFRQNLDTLVGLVTALKQSTAIVPKSAEDVANLSTTLKKVNDAVKSLRADLAKKQFQEVKQDNRAIINISH